MRTVKYRLNDPNLRPRRTRLELPGWAGQQNRRVNGAHEYAWHCVPFTEAATAGIELFYPYENDLHVTMRDGQLLFQGDFGEPPSPEIDWPPFRSFGQDYYTYQILIDIKVDDGYAIKTDPHPRFFTDRSGTCPIAVPAQLRHWWPMMNFCVFKSPDEGRTHIFRAGEPFVQITIVEADEKYELQEMPFDEAAERELQSRRIHSTRETLGADSRWVSDTNTVFDGTYRRILGAFKKKK